MKCKTLVYSLFVAGTLGLTSNLEALDEKESSAAQNQSEGVLVRQMRERQAKIDRLSPEEKASLREAHERASADPEVQAAMEKRNRAVQDYQSEVRASMIKSDPAIAAILKKLMPGGRKPTGLR
jgi:hypothetical protein